MSGHSPLPWRVVVSPKSSGDDVIVDRDGDVVMEREGVVYARDLHNMTLIVRAVNSLSPDLAGAVPASGTLEGDRPGAGEDAAPADTGDDEAQTLGHA